MTSLIDVIFLLLLFFMLTSTFTKYGEIELQTAAGGAAAAATSETERLFLTLRPSGAMLNGTPIVLDELRARLESDEAGATRLLLISLAAETTSQELVDVLTVARGLAGLTPVVLR